MKKLAISTALVVSLASPAMAISVTDIFTGFYSFGDSLTDDGKFGVLDPPSLGGRFSNGPVWAEHIEDDFIAAGHETDNFALGGATAQGPDISGLPDPISNGTFRGQIGNFLEKLSGGENPGSNPLVSVWFGANDLFDSFAPPNVIAAANAVADGIRDLAAIADQSFDDFLVMNLPDIGATPAYGSLLALGGATPAEIAAASAAATAATDLFNAQLAANVLDLRAEGLNIFAFNVQSVFDEIIEDISSGTFSFGIFDAETPCTVSVGAALDPGFENPFNCLDLGIDPNTLLFVDGVHPNAVAHALLADRVAMAVVPLPASLPFLLALVAGFGVVAARRRSA